MTTISRLYSVLLWSFTSLALIFGALGAFSATESIRFVTMTDNSSYPSAPAGSLALVFNVSSQDIVVGDTILVGAQDAQASALGAIIEIAPTESGPLAVTLKASNRAEPDRWSYELGASTYRFVAAAPFVGFFFSTVNNHIDPWVLGAIVSSASIILLLALHFFAFARLESNSDRWFMKLEKEENDGVGAIITQFESLGVPEEALRPRRRRKGRRSSRRKK